MKDHVALGASAVNGSGSPMTVLANEGIPGLMPEVNHADQGLGLKGNSPAVPGLS